MVLNVCTLLLSLLIDFNFFQSTPFVVVVNNEICQYIVEICVRYFVPIFLS
jgi:ABC-type metal ion transport system substrate-binding protein